jgi:cytochrome c-type biogenesis protein CcmH/NrfF
VGIGASAPAFGGGFGASGGGFGGKGAFGTSGGAFGAPAIGALAAKQEERRFDNVAMQVLCKHLAMLDGKKLSDSQAAAAADYYLQVSSHVAQQRRNRG